jgi:cytochrome c biogenesis protein CcdA/thiol-disulfide isomerase/thioredoxin
MILLLGIGFLAGIITALSPCVLPVLPILLAGGATGGRRRPYAIVAGIVLSFTVFTLVAAWLLDLLGLPEDVLRNLAIALLFVLAATLVFPRFGLLLERPLARLTRRRGGDLGGGFLLGASLGLVFVPCAGPVLATISVLAAQHKVGFEAVLLTFFYALGAAVPMLLVAIGGQRAAGRLRAHGLALRRAMGVVVALAALALGFNTEQSLQVALGGYTSALQRHTEATGPAQARLAKLRHVPHTSSSSEYRAAPEFKDIAHWLNTPGDRPLTIAGLRGKVVLVDFWTYSCINCIRTLPHLRAWYAAYHPLGLEIVGVHTPEFAFEHVLGNVRRATNDLHVTWPVALDNDYGTWNAYSNEYWPAEYLIDRSGRVRHVHFGESDYGGSEREIRSLLAQGAEPLPAKLTSVADRTPTEPATPESYLGYERLQRYSGSQIVPNRAVSYRFPFGLGDDELAYAGVWTVGPQSIVAGLDARLRLHFQARYIYLVLGGKGRVQSLIGGKPAGTVDVNGYRLYTIRSGKSATNAILELRFDPGVRAYAFTFG